MIKTLGPKQVMWLRENVPHFRELEQRTEAARHAGIAPKGKLPMEESQPTTENST